MSIGLFSIGWLDVGPLYLLFVISVGLVLLLMGYIAIAVSCRYCGQEELERLDGVQTVTEQKRESIYDLLLSSDGEIGPTIVVNEFNE